MTDTTGMSEHPASEGADADTGDNFDTLFSDKQEFRRFCEYMGIPTTEYGSVTLDPAALTAETLAAAIRDCGCTTPVLLQRRTKSTAGSNYAMVLGNTSDKNFLEDIGKQYGSGETEIIISRFRNPCIPLSIIAAISNVDILIVACCVELHLPDRQGPNFILRNHGCDLDAFKDCYDSNLTFKDIATDMKRSAKRTPWTT